MKIIKRRQGRDLVQDGTAGLPPAGADHALFGTKVEMPYLERKSRGKALATQRRAERRVQRRKIRQALRQAIRPGFVLVLDALGLSGLVYTAWLIWVPLAWGLASIVCIGLAWVLDADDAPGGE